MARSSARCAPSRSSQALPRSGRASRPDLTIRYCSAWWAPARRGGVVDGEILPGPEDERRATGRAGRGAEADAGLDRCAPVVTERRMLLLAPAELVLHRRRDEREVVEAAEIGAPETRRL